MSKVVQEFYDLTAKREASRLAEDPYHSLEFMTTMHYLMKYLPKKGHVLDLGSGPGRYSIELAKKGYDVTLVDLSDKCLSIAKKSLEKEGLSKHVRAVVHANATNLSMLKDNNFDAVLCFGPLYHLIKTSDRNKVINEIKRVAKKDALIFISAISFYGVYGRVIMKYPNELTDKDHVLMIEKGIHIATNKSTFPDAKFYKPRELREALEANGLRTIEMFACEGISTHLREETNRLFKNKKRWKKWTELVIKNSNEPTILGFTEHFVWVGKKI